MVGPPRRGRARARRGGAEIRPGARKAAGGDGYPSRMNWGGWGALWGARGGGGGLFSCFDCRLTRIRAARVPHAARLRSIPCPRGERPRATATDKLRQCRNTYGPEERDHCTGRQLLSARFRQAAQGEARMPTAVTQMVPHIVPCLQTRGRHSFSFGTSQCGHAGVPVQAQEHDQDGEGRPATRRPPPHHSWRCGSPRPRPQLCSGGGS